MQPIPFRRPAPLEQWQQTARVRVIANLLAGHPIHGPLTDYDSTAALALRFCDAAVREDALACAEDYALEHHEELAARLRSCDTPPVIAHGLIAQFAAGIVGQYLAHLNQTHVCPLMDGYQEPRVCRDCGLTIDSGLDRACGCPRDEDHDGE